MRMEGIVGRGVVIVVVVVVVVVVVKGDGRASSQGCLVASVAYGAKSAVCLESLVICLHLCVVLFFISPTHLNPDDIESQEERSSFTCPSNPLSCPATPPNTRS